MPLRFTDLTTRGMFRVLFGETKRITTKLDAIMSREADVAALIERQTAAINRAAGEITELKDAANGAVSRLREAISAQAAAIDALTAEVQAARAGAVSDETLAELSAATDAAVAAADAAVAVADEAEVELNDVAPPTA